MGDSGSIYMDNDSCPIRLSFGIAMRATAQLNVADVKGNFFIGGFGDNASSSANVQLRPTFRLTSGTLSFDGKGGGRLTWTESDEGDVQQYDTSFLYRLRRVTTGGSTTTVIDLLKAATDLNPIATVVPGPGFQTLMFYNPIQIKTVDAAGLGSSQRLVGMGVYVGQ